MSVLSIEDQLWKQASDPSGQEVDQTAQLWHDAFHGRPRLPAMVVLTPVAHLKGAKPVPGPTMMMGVAGSAGSRKSGLALT